LYRYDEGVRRKVRLSAAVDQRDSDGAKVGLYTLL
jgi:hypothetical protein